MYSNSFVTQNQKNARNKSRTAGIQKMPLSEMLGNQSMVLQCCGRRRFTQQEDTMLEQLLKQHDENKRPVIAQSRRRGFTQQEDTMLEQLVKQHGENNWSVIAQSMESKNARQCRDRWKSLHPRVSKPWTVEESRRLENLCASMGLKWNELVFHFPGRTAWELKNKHYQIQGRRNKRKGTEFEEKSLNRHLDAGDALLDVQVRIQSNKSKTIAIVDAIVSDSPLSPGTFPSNFTIIDFKLSNPASLTPNQRIVYPEIESFGGIVIAGLLKGLVIPKGTKVVCEGPK